jgi:hypothetical protein
MAIKRYSIDRIETLCVYQRIGGNYETKRLANRADYASLHAAIQHWKDAPSIGQRN